VIIPLPGALTLHPLRVTGGCAARQGKKCLGDSAAVAGLVLAALGVAIKFGMDSRELLIGRSAYPEVQRLIREEIESQGRPA